MVIEGETAVASTWDIMTYTLTGTLGLGILIGAKSVHNEQTEGWIPPVLLDEREPVPDLVRDWVSPAKLQRLTRPEAPDSSVDQPARSVEGAPKNAE
jgi:hypothetical protein